METRLRHVAELNPSVPEFGRVQPDELVTFIPLEAVWADGLDTSRSRPKHEVDSGYTRFREGDILIPKITPTFQADRSTIANDLANGFGAGTTELHVLRPGPHLDVRFANYVVSSREFLQQGAAEMIGVAGQKRVPEGFVLDFRIHLPTLATQRVTADFLDIEVAHMDRLIVLRRRMAALLAERWLSELDGATAVGASVPVRRVVSLITSGPRGWSEYVGVTGEPFIRAGNLQRQSIRVRTDNLGRVEVPQTPESQRSRTHTGDVCVGITGANTGWVGLIDDSLSGGYVSQHVALMRPSKCQPEWLALSVVARRSQDQLLGGQYGGTKQQLGLEDLANLTIHLPSASEQERLGAGVLRQEERLLKTLRVLAAQTDRLQERRQALITAAVTGQIDVAKAVA